MERDFDRLFTRRTGFADLNEALKRIHDKGVELLLVLDRPEIPLHNNLNLSENDIREWAKKRKISAGTRSGGCCDTGHWIRSGLKPVDALRKMEGRIVSMHLKDVGEWGKPAARDVPLGTGLGDYAEVLGELHRQGFRGVLAIEYEHDSPQLMAEVAQCITFVERTARSLAAIRD